MPQIVHNHKTRCEGLSITMFFFTITGNVTYVASILFKSLDERYVFANLPWLWCVLFIHLLPFFLFPSSPLPSPLPCLRTRLTSSMKRCTLNTAARE